uniref:Replication-associated protein n=1 Tax=Cressdnaviricota sp. TaxID=2748378 RepID=A0A6M3YUI0_9VIRU|nr:MAG: replication-associated protein [Cressdnaviricota sp.]
MAKNSRGPETRFWVFTSFQDKDGFLWYDPESMGYCVQQEETCPTTSRIHWQGFVVFDTKRRLSALKKLLPSAHWEPMRGTAMEAADYCRDPRKRTHEGLLLEDGTFPLCGDAARGASTAARYRDAYDLAIKGEFSKIEPSMMIRHLGNIMKLNSLFGKRPPDLVQELTPGVWLHGAPGCGKTTFCAQYNHYKKDPRHKWFDGYQRENIVVIDDFAPFHVAQTDILKCLGHQFAFQGEVKGGAIWLRPQVAIVTSQYLIDDVWEKDEQSRLAILRRFKCFGLPADKDEAAAYIKCLLPSAEQTCSGTTTTSLEQEENTHLATPTPTITLSLPSNNGSTTKNYKEIYPPYNIGPPGTNLTLQQKEILQAQTYWKI